MMINAIHDLFMRVIVLGCLIGLDAWMILNLILVNKLIRIQGEDLGNNKKKMIEILNDVYSNLDSALIEEDSIKYVNPSVNRWGRRIITLYEGENVYINIVTLGRGQASSFLHGYSNYVKCKRIAEYF